jgi:hypothetical protein
MGTKTTTTSLRALIIPYPNFTKLQSSSFEMSSNNLDLYNALNYIKIDKIIEKPIRLENFKVQN